MSVNGSMESTASSLQRSGLSITVGDTKSIVLALQALQGKIRSLEQDRDYHQDQYDTSLQAHERYKLDMERQMEQERAAHHKREAELLDLLRKAREERAGLEDALSGSKEDLGSFRKELEDMIAAEKQLAQQRESTLTREVTKLREEMREEQTRRAALLVTVEKLKEEREAALRTNEELRIAMDDLLTRVEQLQQQPHRTPLSSEPPRRSSSSGGGTHRPTSLATAAAEAVTVPRRAVSRGRGGGSRGPAHVHRLTRPRVVVHAPHHTYEDSTCCSMLRDVRVAPNDAPRCGYPSVNSAQHTHEEDEEVHHHRNGSSSGRKAHYQPFHEGGRSGRSARGGQNSSGVGPSPTSHRDVSTHASHRRTSSGGITSARRTPTTVATAVAPPTVSSSALGTMAVNEVERQLQQELEELQRQYESTVTRGASEEIPAEVLAAALHRVSSLVAQKKEQVKLLREARQELEEAVGSAVPRDSHNVSGVVKEDRLTRRTMLVNELRSLLAEASM